jgi:hypothetical protein
MQSRVIKRGTFPFLMGLWALAAVTAATVSAAGAQEASPAPAPGVEPQKPARAASTSRPAGPRKTVAPKAAPRYFVEFRSRHAASYGHTFLAHGRLNAKGEIVDSEVAGLHPASESPVPWMIGHLVPVPSETGPSDGDLEDIYVSARYRVELSEAEYAKAASFIKKLQLNSPLWHAVMYNCNAWVADVAQFMGLKTPASTMLMPADFINGMREMNASNEPAETASFTSMREPIAPKEPTDLDSLSSMR